MLLSQPYPSRVMLNSPIIYYRMDTASGSSVTDVTGNSSNGTITGTPIYGANGALYGNSDTAMGLSGSQYISVPTTNTPLGNAPFSVDFWMLINAVPSGYPAVFGMGVTGVRTHMSIYLNPSGQFYVETGGGQIGYLVPSLNVWHYAAVTWNGTTMFVWLDGSSVNYNPGNLALSYGNCVIGNDTGLANFFTGTLDEVAIYGSALSADQVMAHYYAGIDGTSIHKPNWQ